MAAKKEQQPAVNPDETVQEFQQDLMSEAGPTAPAEPVVEPTAEPDPQPEAQAGSDDTVQEFQQEEATADTTTPIVRGEGVAELDKSRDYAQVFGLPGVAFEQDHKYFNFEGFEVKPELEA